MKLIKMKIHRTIDGGHTHFDYPDDYDPYKIKFGPIYELELIPRTKDYCYIIIGINDTDYNQFINANTSTKITKHHFETTDLTEEEAIILGTPWVPITTKISDEAIVIDLCNKLVDGIKLTDYELKQLDANEPELGIKRSKTLAEKLATVK